MKKGLTLLEITIVLGLIPIILGIVFGGIKIQNYLQKSRDIQRLKDLTLLQSALDFYFQNIENPDPDGPILDKRGIDEDYPTIFVSVPSERDRFFETCFYNDKVYYIYQASKNDYQKINGYGWIPINFLETNYQPLSSLPVDPINTLPSGFYYLYAFQKTPLGYEISAGLESTEFKKGGINDKVSTDGGDDENRLEVGTNLKIVPPFIFSF